MKRRDFFKYSGLLGLGGLLPSVSSLNLYAATENYTGPLWLSIDALGGWDPTSFCDPKGYMSESDPERVNNYASTNIIDIVDSPFRVAPIPDTVVNTDADTGYTTETFFNKYKQRLLVINGIDYQTNGHRDGRRYCWSGELARQGYPSFAALSAAELASDRAIPFLINEGYSESAGLTIPVHISNNSLSALFEVAYPNRSDKASNVDSRTYYSQSVADLIRTTQQERMVRIRAEQRLPKMRRSIEKFIAVKKTADQLKKLADFLADIPEKTLDDFNGRKNALSLYQQGRIALAAYKAGVTASAHLSMGGFDTHSDHDTRHHPRLMDYLQATDAILEEANSPLYALGDSLVVTMGSDFGRTNKYNEGDGKDHWPISSMMFIGNSQQRIRGNRLLGGTDDSFKAQKIDPVTLAVDRDQSNANSVSITPAHIHRALRKLAGIENSVTAGQYELSGTDIDLFG